MKIPARGKITKKVVLTALVVMVVGGLLFFGYIFHLWQTLPTLDQISSRHVTQSTKIFDRTGKVLLYEASGGQERTIIPIEEIPHYLKDATVVIEDERFYQEPAFDWRGSASPRKA